MNDLALSLVAFVLLAGGLWWFTRKSEDPYVRQQWQRPIGIFVRLVVLLVVLHSLCVLCQVPIYQGYLALGVFALLALGLDITGSATALFLVVSFVFYEWVFWFPKSRASVLRSSISDPVKLHAGVKVGSSGVALSDLKPTGTVLVGDAEYAARSDLEAISQGDSLVVEAVGDFELVVSADGGERNE